jgi:hypothetical protein
MQVAAHFIKEEEAAQNWLNTGLSDIVVLAEKLMRGKKCDCHILIKSEKWIPLIRSCFPQANQVEADEGFFKFDIGQADPDAAADKLIKGEQQ